MKMKTIRIVFVLFACFATGCGTLLPGAYPAPAYLDVFDCLVPVPPGYAFNTIDSSTTHAYTAEPGFGAWGELNVWNDDGPIPGDRYEIIETIKTGPLTIIEIRLREPMDSAHADETLIVISDGRRKLSLGGAARAHLSTMVETCLSTLP